MHHSLAVGHVDNVKKQGTMADGIAIERVGQVPFDIISKHVDDIVLVSENEIAAAVLAMLELEKSVVEGSGASALAALMHDKIPGLKGKRVGAVVSGSNIDMTLLGRIIQKGLVKSGRMARMYVIPSTVLMTLRFPVTPILKICPRSPFFPPVSPLQRGNDS
jgi:threonine dehydratase